jgi:tetratricopeptide (TPR) repeat protein
MALDFEDAPRPAVWRGRGEAYAELKRWREAAADYERLREAGSLLETDRLALALLRLQLGDAGGYQQVCRAGLEWLSKPPPGISVTVSMKNTFAWTASVAPSSGVDRKKVVELAQGAVAAQPKEYAFQSTLGAALYRDGQDKVAVDTLDHAITLHEGGGTAYEWLFLALAHNRLDHHDKARQWLEKAARKLDAHLAPARWREVVELSLLRREAEEVIKGKPGPGK